MPKCQTRCDILKLTILRLLLRTKAKVRAPLPFPIAMRGCLRYKESAPLWERSLAGDSLAAQ